MNSQPSDALLVVGADGLLGSRLLSHARDQGWNVLGTALAPDPASGLLPLDLNADLDSWSPPAACRAAVLCAAITSLETCRRDPSGTRRINVTQTLRLAQRLASSGIFVTFLSSNLVFDGSGPHVPANAPTQPRTEYGRQKAEVEAGLLALRAPSAIVRLTKVMHPHLAVLQGWITALRANQTIQPFADFVCSPIPLPLVVHGLSLVARGRHSGLWQFSSDSDVSYAAIARRLAQRLDVPPERVQPVGCRDRPPLEHNPAHTTLDASRARDQLGLSFPPPLDAVDQAFPVKPTPAAPG